MSKIQLCPFSGSRDLPLISLWLSRDHVSRWWGERAGLLSELQSRDEGTAALVVEGSRPVGLLCWQTLSTLELEEAGLADLPPALVDVDIMIGEPAALGRGVGPEALRQLFDSLANRQVPVVGLATALENQRALAAFAKVGLVPFRDFSEMGLRYRYFTKWLNKAA